MLKTGTFHVISGLYRDFPFFFCTDFDASKSVLGSFFGFFEKIWPKNMDRRSKSQFFFDLLHLVTWDDFGLYYGHKAQEMILTDVSDPSMPIHWLCLRLTSKFYSPMSPSPKSRKFWLWPDLWRHQWPPGQFFYLVRVVHVQGYRMAFEIWKSVQCVVLNIEILLADVTKPEMSNILTLTWPVTSLVTPRSIKFVFLRQFFQGFQMPLEFLESVQ